MRKIFIAALLAAAAMPANAAPVIKFYGTGPLDIQRNVGGQPPEFTHYDNAFVVLQGTCAAGVSMPWNDCQTSVSANAVSVNGSNNYITVWASLSFADKPVSNPMDGRPLAGTGSGTFILSGGNVSTFYTFTLSHAEVYDDGTIVRAGEVYLPFLGYAVPEPATWAMMIGGFALAGSAMRRARPRYAMA